ncbi:glycoside hydrolase family 32 protein [Nocardioides sp. MAHUQ-72]|uniref:glycoside hydrolase family 32 protein n=1 Tax=unclassified Nocardioides TaxID=2615069 RepID=UPI00360672A8
MSDRRPGYHFTPAQHWMNDPNGLVHLDGTHHLFFQHNPRANEWGNMSWGHATSTDLVHWTEHPVALVHRPEEQIFSGCVVVDHHNTSGFGETGGPAPLVAVYTSVYADGRQAQSLAFSLDAGSTWTTYDANPVLDRGSRHFRDPKVFWHATGQDAGHWVMVAVEAEDRLVLLHRSDDLTSWTPLSTFDPGDGAEGFLECPDLFELPIDGDADRSLWVLVVSVNPGSPAGGSGTRYHLGEFDGTTFTVLSDDTTVPEERRWLDWGRDFYAAVSFDNAPDGRRIMIGWMSNWDYAHVVPTEPWRGAMSLPRELSLRTVADRVTLVQRPAPELAVLEGSPSPVTPGPFVLTGELAVPGGPRYRLDVTFDHVDATELGLDLCVGRDEVTRLRYEPGTGTLSLDRRASGDSGFSPSFASVDRAPVALEEGRLRLEVYVDVGSVEVFAQGGTACLTQLVFPDPDSTGLALVSAGGTTLVHELVHRPIT